MGGFRRCEIKDGMDLLVGIVDAQNGSFVCYRARLDWFQVDARFLQQYGGQHGFSNISIRAPHLVNHFFIFLFDT